MYDDSGMIRSSANRGTLAIARLAIAPAAVTCSAKTPPADGVRYTLKYALLVDVRRRSSGRRTGRHGRSVGTFIGMSVRYSTVLRPATRPGVAGPLPCPPAR